MEKLNLRIIAKELEVAIKCFDEALQVLDGLEDSTVIDEHRQELRVLSKKCMDLESLRDETGTMVIERALRICNVQQAIEEISKVREDFKDARSLINI